MKFIVASETKQTRDVRLAGALNTALAEMNKVTVSLELEGTSTQVIELFGEVRRAYVSYMFGRGTNSQFAAAGITVDVTSYEEALKTKIAELQQLMQARLKELEMPIENS